MAANPIPAPILNPVSSAWNYIKGQCTYYAAQVATWIPSGLGNAADWLANARQKGLHTTDVPTVGSVVVYGRGHGYDPANGHVAVVETVATDLKTFTVGEQNFDERGSVQHGRVSSMSDVLGFILPPGSPAIGNTAPGSNPLDAIGTGFAALGKALTQGVWMVAGVALLALGLIILIARDFLNVRKPQVSVGPAKLSVLDGGKNPAPAKPAAPAAEEA